MATQNKKDGLTLTLVEAVETLSNIADLEFDRDVGIAEEHDLILQDKPLTYHTVHWLHRQGALVTVNMVKEIFRVILHYLRDFYKKDYAYIADSQTLENIKTIMVLVGDAAKKLDRYTMLFHKTQAKSVVELKEYRQLQEFYLKRIAKKIDEGVISQWILALARRGGATKEKDLESPRRQSAKHVFMDLETVKKDVEYELFFLKKEDGTRFFSPRLIRNIKLISDFGNYLGKDGPDDPLFNIEAWEDQAAFQSAKNIMRSIRGYARKFYKGASRATHHEIVDFLNKSLVALAMAGNSHHLIRYGGIKSCRDYFYDFQVFLRSCLRSTSYQKLMAYAPEKPNRQTHSALYLIHFMCMALYTQLNGYREFLSPLHELIHQATEKLCVDHKKAAKTATKLWLKLAGDYAALTKLLKGHVNGPLNKVLNLLEEGECHQFDPIFQENLPSQLYNLYVQENRYQFARWPSPTYQEFIHKAVVNEEFKAFLHGCIHRYEINKVLIINFQERVSWKEHSRCVAIEDLPNHESFARHVDVVTLAKDTEFYHQLVPFSAYNQNQADIFMKDLKEDVASKTGGFFFPEAMRGELIQNFVPGVVEAIHRIFFSQKNLLLREHRLDFIEIFYLFLQLKIIEYLKPDMIGFSCKDGLDISGAAGAELFVFLKFMNQERLSENDQEHLELMLYGPCLILRERMMVPDRFNRMLSALKTLELVREQFGQGGFVKIIQEAFSSFYKTPILKGKVVMQNSKDVF